MKLKKIMMLFLVSFLLSGCSLNSIQQQDKKIGNLKVSAFDNDNVTYQRNISGGYKIVIECKNFREDMSVDVYLYEHGNLVAKNNEDGIFLSDVEINLIKHDGILQVKEHVYYYDAKNSENNFGYDEITDTAIDTHDDLEISTYASKDLRWEIVEVSKATFYMIKTGVSNPKLLYVLYTYTVTILWMVLSGITFYFAYHYSIACEYQKKIRILDVVNIIMFLLMLFFDYSDTVAHNEVFDLFERRLDAICKLVLVLGLLIRALVTAYIVYDWKENPPKPYVGHKWMIEAKRKMYGKKEEK